MDFFDVFMKMLVILLTMAAGAVAHRLGYLGGDVDQKLSGLLLNITMPMLILSSVINGDNRATAGEILSLVGISLLLYAVAFAFALVVPAFLKGDRAQKGAWRYALAFSNVSFIGFPVAVALYGQGALFYAAILILPMNLLSYTLGPLMLAGRGRFRWQQLVSPCVVSALIALALAFTGWQPPALVGQLTAFVGEVTIPFSLLIIGSLLAGLPAGEILNSPKAWLLTVFRLLVMPITFSLLLQPLHLDPVIHGVAVTQIGMPVAINGTLMSMEYGGDTEGLARVTFLTTVASMVTIPLIAALFL